MATKEEQLFFELLRAGLWDKDVEMSLSFEAVDWDKVIQYADNQAVTAVALDGLETIMRRYGSDVGINKLVLLSWTGETLLIENQNWILNDSLRSLEDFFHQCGVRTILLKGQGCASLYPKPLHRSSGDIDLFVGMEQYEKTKEIVKQKGITVEKETRKDCHFTWEEIPVECHKMAVHYYSPIINRPLQQINRTEEWSSPSRFILDGQEIALFNPTYNAFFIFMHIHHHFVQTGIGLRQICDWVLLLHHHVNEIDWDKLHQYLRQVKVLRAWVTFYGFAKKYLALDIQVPEWMRCYKNSDVEFLYEDIFAVGNFGQTSESMKTRSFNKGLLSNIHSYWALTKRLFGVFKYGKEEVMAYPVWKVLAKLGIVRY